MVVLVEFDVVKSYGNAKLLVCDYLHLMEFSRNFKEDKNDDSTTTESGGEPNIPNSLID